MKENHLFGEFKGDPTTETELKQRARNEALEYFAHNRLKLIREKCGEVRFKSYHKRYEFIHNDTMYFYYPMRDKLIVGGEWVSGGFDYIERNILRPSTS